MGKTIRYNIVKACIDEYNLNKGDRKRNKKKYKMPRGDSIPPGKAHTLKNKYNRRKQKIKPWDQLDLME